jgi:hypothetical protein
MFVLLKFMFYGCLVLFIIFSFSATAADMDCSKKLELQTNSPLQMGIPSLFSGIPMKEFFWFKEGPFFGEDQKAFGIGNIRWGRVVITLYTGSRDELDIVLTPASSSLTLTKENQDSMAMLFPTLSIKPEGEKELRINLTNNDPKDTGMFARQSRRLIGILLHDSQGLLTRMAPTLTKFGLPKALMQEDFIYENLNFFGNYGRFERHVGFTFAALHKRDHYYGKVYDTALKVNITSKQMSFWLENDPSVEGLLSNIRRIIWIMLRLYIDTDFDLLPKTRIDALNGVSIIGLPFDGLSIQFISALDAAQNDARYLTPLPKVSASKLKFIEKWMQKKLDYGHKFLISLNDIVKGI